MMAKVITIILNWVSTAVILPLIAFFYDSYRLRKENKILKANIETLKLAKNKPEIDKAIDEIN